MEPDDLDRLFAAVDTTAICDAARSARVMDSGIRLRSANPRILGPAYTVRCRGDLLGFLRAIEAAAPGDVVVADGGGQELALGGELFARGARVRGLAGLIVDGGYRDIGYVSTCDLPVYSRSVTPLAGTATHLGEVQTPVSCGGVVVCPGDMILADREGVLVLDPADVTAALRAAARVKEREAAVIRTLEAGSPLSAATNLAEHVAAVTRGEPSTLRFLD
jgi:4-hydroxy-4-methyl-2-oxoglutarate aldolase